MKQLQIFIISLVFTICISWFYSASSELVPPTAPLFTGMGTHHHAVTTKSTQAQRYFDQGKDTASHIVPSF